jgi:hypothetical protein
MWKEAVKALPGQTEENNKNIRKDSQFLGWDINEGPEQHLAHREENQLTLLHQKFRFQVWRQLPPAGLSKLPRARKEVSGTVVGQGP